MKYFFYVFILSISFFGSIIACKSKPVTEQATSQITLSKPDSILGIIVGAEQFDVYKPLIESKSIGLVVNQTSMVRDTHLVDFLVKNKINVKRIFAPEHGFRGNYGAGEWFNNEKDSATGISIVAMFGKNKGPTQEQIKDLDIIIFDIQDVGARFFTYISSMHEVMEVCAVYNKQMIVFDRPNPTGDYIDGPVLQSRFKSFVGMHQIPIVHGLTVGELAQMINGEKWLKEGKQCNLKVIPVKNYTHKTRYSVKIKPSPSLYNDLAIRLYPSLCLFEATNISTGRGTDFPFQVIGYPDTVFGSFTFTPREVLNVIKDPPQKGNLCYGIDLRNTDLDVKFTLKYVIDAYQKMQNINSDFFSRPKWFNMLSGNDILIQQIKSGLSEDEIKKTWQPDLEKYKNVRKKYLLYPDFE